MLCRGIAAFLAAGLLPAVVIAAPRSNGQVVLQAGDTPVSLNAQPTAEKRKLQGRFLHITDLHPDGFYKVHSSTEESIACHRGQGPAGTYGAETSDCDSPYSLVNATLDWVVANLKDQIDFVIWTGDSARHDSDEKIPRTEKEVIGSNRIIADKFFEAFSTSEGLEVPIIPTFGNNDILPHNVLLPGPNKWLKTYNDVWRNFIPEEQRHSFDFGGWYYVEAIPNKLAVFSLNTLYFFDRNAGIDDCASPLEPGFQQFEWLRVQLQFLRERNMKAILTGHVPPARTSNKQLWDETCWQKYTLWLQQYRDVIVGSVYGHMNIDHFLIQDTEDLDFDFIRASVGDEARIRETMDDELSIQSSADYLQDLRNNWAKLPKAAMRDDEENANKKKGSKKKNRELGGKWAERFQLTLVSPSVVPNYLPTLRVVQYNISGLEENPTWSEVSHLARPVSGYDQETFGTKKRPSLVIPEPPSKDSPPGPAYSPQPLTFLGYDQYYANLTYINNDMTFEEEDVSTDRWNEGKHKDKTPKNKNPQPREFAFEVLYSTLDDKLYKLKDLTVRSFVDLAYRIGQAGPKSNSLESDLVDRDADGEDDDETDEGGDVEADKKKKKKHGKKKKATRLWLHFLGHAFVDTVSKDKLKDM